ncbi:MAG: hypothetical protein WDZ51_11330, partial [Pirellulaceae bacterium]
FTLKLSNMPGKPLPPRFWKRGYDALLGRRRYDDVERGYVPTSNFFGTLKRLGFRLPPLRGMTSFALSHWNG